MISEAMTVGVIVERRRLASKWVDHAWLPVAVLPGAPAVEPWTVLDETEAATRFYAGPFELRIYSSETGMYRDNLASGRPGLWVALRETAAAPGIAVQTVTADPSEGEALTEPGNSIVEVVPMPDEIRERLAAFVTAHHVERPFVKRRRDRADPEIMAHRPGLRRTEDES